MTIQHSDLTQLFEYMLENKLTIDETLLLYTVYVHNEARNDVRLLQLMRQYYDTMSFYDQQGQPLRISWSTVVQKLERDGFLDCFAGHASPGKNQNMTLQLNKLQVTDKFKNSIISSNREQLWEFYVAEIYGPEIIIKGQSQPTAAPVQGQSMDQLLDDFWKICDNGLISKFNELCRNTQDYFDHFEKNMKIGTFLRGYEGNMLSLKLKKAKLAESSPWTGSM